MIMPSPNAHPMPLEEDVLRRLRPSPRTLRELDEAVGRLLNATEERISGTGLDLRTMLVGSVAKGTFVGRPDIDLFVLFPTSVERGEFERIGLQIGREVLGGETRYAEHPYTHGRLSGFDVDLVPCYAIEDPTRLRTAVDRTPFHTKYVLEHLTDELREQVLLLKQFMKGVGVYGAEAKVRGFSGYLTELLVISYGSMQKVLRAGAGWRPGIVMDMDGRRKGKGSSPLTFWDPVDPKRNVASALSLDRFSLFVHACREYLSAPSERFFFPRKRQPLGTAEARMAFEGRGTTPFVVVLDRPELVDDNLYPQVERSLGGLRRLLEMYGFQVQDAAYSVGVDVRMAFELSSALLPPTRLHQGPPAWTENAEEFVRRWRGEGVGQPFLAEGRWMVYAKREFRDPASLIMARGAEAALGNSFKGLPGLRCHAGEKAFLAANRQLFTGLLDRRESWRV